MTLRLYAERKALPLERVSVAAQPTPGSMPPTARLRDQEGKIDRIERTITLESACSTTGRAKRMMEIADKCPVRRTLTSEINIRTVEQPVQTEEA